MTAPVADLNRLRTSRDLAKAKHPSSTGRPANLAPEIRASLLITVARTWDALVDLLAKSSTPDAAEGEVLTICTALVHPDAVPALGAFTMPELRRVVDQLDAIERGDISHKDLDDCASYEEAMADARADVDYELWPLLSGRPTREACRGCRHRLPVHAWRTQIDCPDHREGRAL